MFQLPEIEIAWEGDEHRIPMTMNLIRQIENITVDIDPDTGQPIKLSTLELAMRLGKGNVPMGTLAGVFQVILKSVGVASDDEQIYGAMIHGKDGVTGPQWVSMVTQAVSCIYPQNAPEAEDKPQGKGKKKAVK
jgi:hypothetical protein